MSDSRETSASESTERSNSPSASAYFCGESAASRLRAPASAVIVSNVPSSVRAIGSAVDSPSMTFSIDGLSGKPPLSRMPASDGKVCDSCATRVPTSTSDRSPGTTTTAPSSSRGSTFSSDIAATTVAEHRALEQRGVAAHQLGVGRLEDGAQQRGDQGRLLGDDPARHALRHPRGDGRRDLVEVLRIDAVGDHGDDRGVLVVQLRQREVGRRRRRRAAERGPSPPGFWPPVTSSTEAARSAAMRPFTESSVGVPTSV